MMHLSPITIALIILCSLAVSSAITEEWDDQPGPVVSPAIEKSAEKVNRFFMIAPLQPMSCTSCTRPYS